MPAGAFNAFWGKAAVTGAVSELLTFMTLGWVTVLVELDGYFNVKQVG